MVGFMGRRMSATVCLLVERMSIEGLMMGEMNFGVTCDFVYMHSQLSLCKKVKESLFQIYELMIIQIKGLFTGHMERPARDIPLQGRREHPAEKCPAKDPCVDEFFLVLVFRYILIYLGQQG